MTAELTEIEFANTRITLPRECALYCPSLQEMAKNPSASSRRAAELGEMACSRECQGPIIEKTKRVAFAVCEVTGEEYEVNRKEIK